MFPVASDGVAICYVLPVTGFVDDVAFSHLERGALCVFLSGNRACLMVTFYLAEYADNLQL